MTLRAESCTDTAACSQSVTQGDCHLKIVQHASGLSLRWKDSRETYEVKLSFEYRRTAAARMTSILTCGT